MAGDPLAEALLPHLERARTQGFLGPGPLRAHLDHARSWAASLSPAGWAVDLGSGAGLPGLPLALLWPECRWLLVEASERRATLLEQTVRALGLVERVTVECRRAEEVGRGPARGRHDLVVARAFGPPAVTAECAAPLLSVGGRLSVSEPPAGAGAGGRWDPLAEADLGLAVVGVEGAEEGPRFVLLEQRTPAPSRYPRRRVRERPLF